MVRRYRRSRRYGRKTLRSSNIYTRTSAKSQARQIVALNRRVSRVYKSLRPDTNVYLTDAQSIVFTNSSTGTVYNMTTFTSNSFKDASGTALPSLPGDSRKLYNMRLFGNVEYSDDYVQTSAVDHQRTCSFRVIIGQYIRTASSAVSQNSILEISRTGTGYELNAVRPLRDNVTSYVKILLDRPYSMSDQSPIRQLRYNFRKLLPFRTDAVDGNYHYGSFFVLLVTAGLHWDSSYSQQIKANYGLKLALPEH